jgi:hypothetical protein
MLQGEPLRSLQAQRRQFSLEAEVVQLVAVLLLLQQALLWELRAVLIATAAEAVVRRVHETPKQLQNRVRLVLLQLLEDAPLVGHELGLEAWVAPHCGSVPRREQQQSASETPEMGEQLLLEEQ